MPENEARLLHPAGRALPPPVAVAAQHPVPRRVLAEVGVDDVPPPPVVGPDPLAA